MSTKFLLFSFSTLLLGTLFSFDHAKNQPFKNETLLGNLGFQHSQVIPIPDAVGPESFEFDMNGDGPYTGVSDGRIIKWRGNESRWIDFAVTSPKRDGCERKHDHSTTEHICGRPLGLRFNEKTGHLYIADAYMGLLVVGPNGGLSTQINRPGLDLGFTNSLDIDQSTGVVYFTDSSRRYQRRNFISVILSGDSTGRLMKYDPRNNKTTVILNNLKFPNGIALSRNGDFLILAETTTCKLLKFWLQTQKAGILEEIATLPGFPDNIKRNGNGEFWIGINSRKGKFLDWILSSSWIGSNLIKLPLDITKWHTYLAYLSGSTGMGIKLNEDGNIEKILDSTKWQFVSEVKEENGNLWIGSVKMPFGIKQNISV
ncbi:STRICTOSIDINE SYNTHASE-LIKE 2-like [Olea europaea subsp. europaea]|uniref:STRICTOSIDINE SYNTHASE-LIKE 2-like n=1 Tax=Olea europaea subsp. europaea TaxID=158383 RepID=A0A8S0PP15_OLEEU|nr:STRICTOSIDINE SYNTHASE-LIKE 2-like [Olea europaea subsp. europaea]